jgi:hypothetical protein
MLKTCSVLSEKTIGTARDGKCSAEEPERFWHTVLPDHDLPSQHGSESGRGIPVGTVYDTNPNQFVSYVLDQHLTLTMLLVQVILQQSDHVYL